MESFGGTKTNRKKSRVLRILWPIQGQETPGWVIGWIHNDFLTVATVVKDDINEQKAEVRTGGDGWETEPGQLSSSPGGSPDLTHCGSASKIGRIDSHDGSSEDWGSMRGPEILQVPEELSKRVSLLNQSYSKEYWKSELQVLGLYDLSNSLLLKGCRYGFGSSRAATGSSEYRPQLLYFEGNSSAAPPHQVVLYTQPQQNQMYSDLFEWKKSHLTLTSGTAAQKNIFNPSKSFTPDASKDQPDQSKANIKLSGSQLINSGNTMLGDSLSGSSNTTSHKSSNAPPDESSIYLASLHQINTSRSVQWMLTSKESPLNEELTNEKALEAFRRMRSHHRPFLWTISRIQVFLLTSVMWLLNLVNIAINMRIPGLGRVAEFGLLGSFLEKRLVILMNFKDQYVRLNTVYYMWRNEAGVQRAWLRFYNTSLSMLVDSMLGIISAYFLWRWLAPDNFSNHVITSHMTTLWGYDWLKANIEWITVGAPAGLKLNIATTNALGSLFLFYIERWSIIVRQLAQFAPFVLVAVTLSGFFGLSMMIVLIHDVIYFVNMHIYWLYAAITRVYYVQLVLLRSLWLLFRGKKNNVLKQRIDSCNASLDQLVLGTLLFTSLIFLLPTTAMYYMFFVYVMLIVLVLQALAQIIVNLLNYSPFYSILLYICNSGLLTGGVHFQVLDPATRLATSTSTTSLVILGLDSAAVPPSSRRYVSFFKLKTNKVAFSVLLGDLNKAMGIILANYQIKKLINCILLGQTWQNKRFQPNRIKPT